MMTAPKLGSLLIHMHNILKLFSYCFVRASSQAFRPLTSDNEDVHSSEGHQSEDTSAPADTQLLICLHVQLCHVAKRSRRTQNSPVVMRIDLPMI